MFRLFAYLEKNKKKRASLENSQEYKFFLENREILLKNRKFVFLYDADSEFMVFRANIIINGLLNKKKLEDEITNVEKHIDKGEKISNQEFKEIITSKMAGLPFYQDGDTKIYMPFFPRNINILYLNEPHQLLNYPYHDLMVDFDNSIIDGFDKYGSELYNSHFSRLVKICSNGNESAYFHYDFNTCYIVNEQGRLDVRICLFDKHMRRIENTHMHERLRPVIDAYYNNDRALFIENMHNSGFISSKLYRKIIHKSKR